MNKAKNESLIADIFAQISEIPLQYDSEETYIFLSIGGNNILQQYYNSSKDHLETNMDSDFLLELLKKYDSVLKALRVRMKQTHILLTDVYYPKQKFKQK